MHKGGGGTDSVRECGYLFTDVDSGIYPKYMPEPTLCISSGKGYHLYWRLDKAINVEQSAGRRQFDGYMRRLVKYAGGDENCKDIARVMRLPGSVNHKYPKPVTVQHVSDVYYPLAFWDSLLPRENIKPLSYHKAETSYSTPPSWMMQMISTPSAEGNWNRDTIVIAGKMSKMGFDESLIHEMTMRHALASGKTDRTHECERRRIVKWVISRRA